MKSSARSSEVRAYSRCRPALGTFVEVSLSGASEKVLSKAGERAFRAIEEISKKMSFHDPDSELSRLNRAPVGKWIRISGALQEVLMLALELQRDTCGVFNVAIAEALAGWGVLPGKGGRIRWNDLRAPGFEVRRGRARRILPVKIDLGGIAKGYAVDCAARAVLKSKVPVSGIINAGGDLRVFGAQARLVWIRTEAPHRNLEPIRLNRSSIATSSVVPVPCGTRAVSHYVDLARKAPLLRRKTVSVRAASCVIADALTKIALLSPSRDAGRIARRYRARIQVHA